MNVNLLDSSFNSVKTLDIGDRLDSSVINVSTVHQVVKGLLANRRQGNACTKNKALVSGGGKKPFKQKGTGRARQGSTRSPLMPGGGVAFGPRPRSFEQKINKKVMLGAIRSVLADKQNAGKLIVVEDIKSNGKTKDFSLFLKNKGIESGLLVVSNPASLVLRAAKNLEKFKPVLADGFSVYDAVKYETLIVDLKAFNKLIEKVS